MLCYRDMTFCVNKECSKKCSKYLTCEIEEKARAFGIPLAVASFICLDCDDDGVYRYEKDKENEEVS